MQKKLEETEPEIEPDIKEGTKDAIMALDTRRADAYIGNLIVTSFLLQRNGITNIKAACLTPYGDHSQAMVTRKEWAPLISIIDKGLASMPQEQKVALRNKYLQVRFEHGITTAEVLKWILIITGAFSGVVLVFVVWNKQLSRKVQARTVELSESESRFRATFEQAAVGVAHVSTDGQFLRLNQKFCDTTGYAQDEMITLMFQDITHPDDLEKDLDYVLQLLDGQQRYLLHGKAIDPQGLQYCLDQPDCFTCSKG